MSEVSNGGIRPRIVRAGQLEVVAKLLQIAGAPRRYLYAYGISFRWGFVGVVIAREDDDGI